METVENKIIKVLLIEDNAGDARLIQELLKDIEDVTYELTCVAQLQEALAYLANHDIDIVLSDLSLPDSPGLETFKRLQTQIAKVPVIVLTGFDNKAVALEAVRDGAQDYLIKGQVEGKTLSRLILYAIERYRTQANLRNLSLTDPLTGLYNRRGFMTLGEQALKSARRTKVGLSLFFADLDGLKKINDTFGHKEGDRAIVGAAQGLRKTFREADIMARLGGDEFAILATQDAQNDLDGLITRLQGNLREHNEKNLMNYRLSLSVGVAAFDPNGTATLEELLAKADEVLYIQKKERKGFGATLAGKKARRLMILSGLLILPLFLFWGYQEMQIATAPITRPSAQVWRPARPIAAKPEPLSPPVSRPAPPPVHSPIAARRPAPSSAAPIAAPKPAAPSNEIHQELIPKDIAIVRFYYDQQVVSPGAAFGFDVNGSGFTSEFQKSLSVVPGAPALEAKNLRLATANQIRGDMNVDSNAATQYVFPRVLLKNHAVFQAPQPFAVIRPGEVLDIVFASLDPDGRGGRFRIFTNLSPEMAKQFRVKTSASGLSISALEPHLPFLMEGTLRLKEGVDHGDYDLIALLGSKEIFRKKQLLHIVSPNVGQTGFIQSLKAGEFYHRPGDNVELFLQGSGFAPDDIEALTARVDEIDMGKLSYTFISPTQLSIYFTIPKEIPEGSYGILIEQDHQLLWRQKNVFSVVPANWLAAMQMAPVGPGEKGLLKITGRDLSADFIKTLSVQTDDPGIHISTLRRLDASTVNADIEVDSSVAPGDYMLDITSKGVPVKLQGDSLITIHTP